MEKFLEEAASKIEEMAIKRRSSIFTESDSGGIMRQSPIPTVVEATKEQPAKKVEPTAYEKSLVREIAQWSKFFSEPGVHSMVEKEKLRCDESVMKPAMKEYVNIGLSMIQELCDGVNPKVEAAVCLSEKLQCVEELKHQLQVGYSDIISSKVNNLHDLAEVNLEF